MVSTILMRYMGPCLIRSSAIVQQTAHYKMTKKEFLAGRIKQWFSENKHIYGPVLKKKKVKTKKLKSKRNVGTSSTTFVPHYLNNKSMPGSQSIDGQNVITEPQPSSKYEVLMETKKGETEFQWNKPFQLSEEDFLAAEPVSRDFKGLSDDIDFEDLDLYEEKITSFKGTDFAFRNKNGYSAKPLVHNSFFHKNDFAFNSKQEGSTVEATGFTNKDFIFNDTKQGTGIKGFNETDFDFKKTNRKVLFGKKGFNENDFVFYANKNEKQTFNKQASFKNEDFAFDTKQTSENFKDMSTAPKFILSDEELKEKEKKDTETHGSSQGGAEDSSRKTSPELEPVRDFPLILPNKTIMKSIWPSITKFPMFFEESEKFASVSKILQKTQSPESVLILERWKKKMIALLGEEGLKKLQADTFRNGAQLHSHIHDILSGKKKESEILIKPENEGHWRSLAGVLENVGAVHVLETPIRHPYLRYGGIVDCVAEYNEQLCVLEWKTSKKPKPSLKDTFDNPVQVAAYMGAINSTAEATKDLVVKQGLVVIAYENGDKADLHYMSEEQCTRSWHIWTRKVCQYWEMELKAKKILDNK